MSTRGSKTPHILISDHEQGLPFSKGLMASQVMVTGLSPFRSYQVAEAVEDRLIDLAQPSVTSSELGEITLAVLREVAGERYAKNYIRWREVESLDIPLVVLIGGTTGVGKSTLATQLAARLGIVRVVATDAIREVMRSMFSAELMPTLYTSSFQADTALREPPEGAADALVVGFREQTAAVGGRHQRARRPRGGGGDRASSSRARTWYRDSSTPHAERILAVPVVLDGRGRGHAPEPLRRPR